MMDEHDNNSITPGTDVSLRDFFAAAAMQGLLASWPKHYPHPLSTHETRVFSAIASYEMADAMIKRRKRDAAKVA